MLNTGIEKVGDIVRDFKDGFKMGLGVTLSVH